MRHGAVRQEGRPRGRPQRLPTDGHPIDSGAWDNAKRLAWLMATNRLLARDSAWAVRSQFIDALLDDGLSVDSSRLSRWEAGTVRPSASVLRAYEQRCGMADDSLTAADRLMHRTSGSQTLPTRCDDSLSVSEFDDLFERLEHRHDLTGGDWLRLSCGLAQVDTVYLHTSVWQVLCARLVNELTRSSGIAFVRRYEAATQLLTHRRAPRHLMRALGELVMDPHAQNVVPALTLLREVGDGAAADLVVRLIAGDVPLLRRGASIAAGGLAARDAFTGESLTQVERFVGSELRRAGDGSQRLDIIDIATQLPEDAFARILISADTRTQRRLTRARLTGELAPVETARVVADQMAASAERALNRSAHDPDQMLRRLLREALFHAQRERRHLAATLIGLSPYGVCLAEIALESTHGRSDLVARMSWSLLRRLGHLIDREKVSAALDATDHPSRLAHGMITLGLASGPIDARTDTLLTTQATDSPHAAIRHAALFALGLSGHDRLHDLAASGHDLATAAAWWIATGPALHDVDPVPACR